MNDGAQRWSVVLVVAVALFIASRTQRGQAAIAAGVDNVAGVVRGIRNKNPGNLRANKFRGALGVDAGGYAKYDTMQNGVRASARQLALYFSRSINTVERIISTWAPASENNTARYVADVAKQLGVDAKRPLVLTEELHADLLRAIFRKELGAIPAQLITDAMIVRGIREA